MLLVTIALGGVAGLHEAGAQAQTARGDGVPAFVQVNKRYVVRWQPGDVETYRVLEITDGWVKAESEAKDAPTRMVLWLNLRQAITITEVP
jgi:hypothetical protein